MPKLQQVLESILAAMNKMYRRQFACIPMMNETQFNVRASHSKSQQRTDQRVLVLTLKFLALKKLFFPP